MKNLTLIALGLAGSLGLAACNSDKTSPPPVQVNGDATPPADSTTTTTTTTTSNTITTPQSAASSDPTLAATTGDSVRGTGDTRAVSKVIDDSWITTKTNTALLAETSLKSGDIHVETLKGTVTLSGTVPTETERTTAARVARDIEGVNHVDNRLTLK